MGALQKTWDLSRKNLRAAMEAMGYRMVQSRSRKGARMRSRLARRGDPTRDVLRPPASLSEIAAERYFTVKVDARPGINHLRDALRWLIRESLCLRRTPVVFDPRMDPVHNLGYSLETSWDRYIDLDDIQVRLAPDQPLVRLRALRMADIAPIESRSALRIPPDYFVKTRENQRFELIERHNPSGLVIAGVHGQSAGLAEMSVEFVPAPFVREHETRMRSVLGEYHAMHVRRGDMLSMRSQFPHLAEDTRPERILHTLSGVLPYGSRIYILTDERDRNYFDLLRERYEIVQYFDFPQLRCLIECERPDNFLLFEIEKRLFDGARTRIHTFAHPNGAPRIHLCRDRHWS